MAVELAWSVDEASEFFSDQTEELIALLLRQGQSERVLRKIIYDNDLDHDTDFVWCRDAVVDDSKSSQREPNYREILSLIHSYEGQVFEAKTPISQRVMTARQESVSSILG